MSGDYGSGWQDGAHGVNRNIATPEYQAGRASAEEAARIMGQNANGIDFSKSGGWSSSDSNNALAAVDRLLVGGRNQGAPRPYIQSFSELTIVRGVVSNVNRSSQTTTHSTNFRVNEKPINWSSNLEIADGDKVSVAIMEVGSLGVLVVNNTTNSVTFSTADFYKDTSGSMGPMVLFFILVGVGFLVAMEGGIHSDRNFLVAVGFWVAAFFWFRFSSKRSGMRLARLNEFGARRKEILLNVLQDPNGVIAKAVELESQVQV